MKMSLFRVLYWCTLVLKIYMPAQNLEDKTILENIGGDIKIWTYCTSVAHNIIYVKSNN